MTLVSCLENVGGVIVMWQFRYELTFLRIMSFIYGVKGIYTSVYSEYSTAVFTILLDIVESWGVLLLASFMFLQRV